MSKEAMKLALEALEGNTTNPIIDPEQAAIEDKAITALREALAEQPVAQQQVAFLANGTRFKISYDSRQSGGQIHGIPPELVGRWVAFVAADDDFHLKLTSAPAQRTWVNLTDDELRQVWYDDDPVQGGTYIDKLRQVEEKLRSKNA